MSLFVRRACPLAIRSAAAASGERSMALLSFGGAEPTQNSLDEEFQASLLSSAVI